MTLTNSTFDELGAPFPLFQAPAHHAGGFCGNVADDGVGRTTCALCRKKDQICFVPQFIIINCPKCQAINGLEAMNPHTEPCHACQEPLNLPDYGGDHPTVCYSCLRSAKAAYRHDTSVGIISWKEALVDGITDDVDPPSPEGEALQGFKWIDRKDGGKGVALPQEVMLELITTPSFGTWQQHYWPFCHQRPMVYLGGWKQEDFERHAPDGNGRKFFEELLEDVPPDLWEAELEGDIGIYIYRCSECGGFRGFWDMS